MQVTFNGVYCRVRFTQPSEAGLSSGGVAEGLVKARSPKFSGENCRSNSALQAVSWAPLSSSSLRKLPPFQESLAKPRHLELS